MAMVDAKPSTKTDIPTVTDPATSPPATTTPDAKIPTKSSPNDPKPASQTTYDKEWSSYIGWSSGLLNKLCEEEQAKRAIADSKAEYANLAVQEAKEATKDLKTAQDKANHAFRALIALKFKIISKGGDPISLPDDDNDDRNTAKPAASPPTMSSSDVARGMSHLTVSDTHDNSANKDAVAKSLKEDKKLNEDFGRWADRAFAEVGCWPVSAPTSRAASFRSWRVFLPDPTIFPDHRSATLGLTPPYDQLLCEDSGSSGGYVDSLDMCVPRLMCSLYSDDNPADV